MKKLNTILWMMAAVVIGLTSCKKEDDTTPSNANNTNPDAGLTIPSSLIKLGETYIPGAATKAVVYADKAASVGYIKIYTAMYDSVTNARVKDGHFSVNPIMDMGTMKHSAPVENGSDSVPADQLFKSAVVFSMGGAWTLDINSHNHLNNKEGKGVLALNVTNPTTAVMRNFVVAADDSTRLFVSLVQPASPKIGLNDFEITIHKKADMMNYPAVENYTVEIEPEMPSMGHGSPNNVNPVHTTNGHYLGKVNFTMSGLWRVHLTIKKNGVLLSNDQYFDITF
jgi:hypothetical protein